MNFDFNSQLLSAHRDFQNGSLDESQQKLEKLLKIQSNNVDVLFILAVIYGIKKNHQAAMVLLEKAVKKQPNNSDINLNLAKAYLELDFNSKAIKLLEKIVRINSNNTEAWNYYGLSLLKVGENNKALECFNKAININENHTHALLNKSIALNNNGEFEKALELINSLIKKDEKNIIILFNKGVFLLKKELYEDSIILFNRCIEINQFCSDAYCHRGIALQKVGSIKESLIDFDKCLEMDDKNLKCLINKGISLYYIKELDNAKKLFEHVINLNPSNEDAHYNLSLVLLENLDFDQGWKEYEYRFNASNFKTKNEFQNLKKWSGELSINNLLIWSEQGIGDQILFLTVLNDITIDFNKITLLVPLKLVDIVSEIFPNIKVISEIGNEDLNKFDAQLPIGGLAALYRNSINKFPKKVELLKINNIKNSAINKFIQNTEGLKIGISWKSTNDNYGKHKSIELCELVNFALDRKLTFINLQYGNVFDEISSVNQNSNHIINICHEVDLYDDLRGLLELIHNCDIVITTSNTTAHMVGAMGKEAILLIPYSYGSLWYWNEVNAHSLWYPSIKILRQKCQGNWTEPIKDMIKFLKDKYD